MDSLRQGGLRILGIQNMNTALLTRQVARLMSPQKHLVTQVLKESYSRGLNWEKYAAPIQGSSPF